MIFDNALPKLKEATEQVDRDGKHKEVKFIYNELLTNDTIVPVFEWLFRQGYDFKTRRDEYRFVVVIFPKTKD